VDFGRANNRNTGVLGLSRDEVTWSTRCTWAICIATGRPPGGPPWRALTLANSRILSTWQTRCLKRDSALCISRLSSACRRVIRSIGSGICWRHAKSRPMPEYLAHSGEPVLVEVYRRDSASGQHGKTDQHRKCPEAVAAMMAEPRSGVKSDNVSADEEDRGQGRLRSTRTTASMVSAVRMAGS
jgi:hypothetical protein